MYLSSKERFLEGLKLVRDFLEDEKIQHCRVCPRYYTYLKRRNEVRKSDWSIYNNLKCGVCREIVGLPPTFYRSWNSGDSRRCPCLVLGSRVAIKNAWITIDEYLNNEGGDDGLLEEVQREEVPSNSSVD